jgi:hypothetical protein
VLTRTVPGSLLGTVRARLRGQAAGGAKNSRAIPSGSRNASLAADLLATTDLTVYDIARRAGYQSEEAFSRAFKRERGQPPAHWRSAHR